MFARRFANHGLRRKDKMFKKYDVQKATTKFSGKNVCNQEDPQKSRFPLPKENNRRDCPEVLSQLPPSGRPEVGKSQRDLEAVLPINLPACDEPQLMDSDEIEETEDATYARDIHNYLKTVESKCCPRPDFLGKTIKDENRKVLVAWLKEVQVFLGIHQETYHLAITIVDNIVDKVDIQLHEYQLLGLLGIYIAAKFLERYVPDIETLVYLTSYTYSYNLFTSKEKVILKELDYDLNLPTSSWFLSYYTSDEGSRNIKDLAKSLLDLYLLDSASVSQISPSLRAASALSVAYQIHGKRSHPQELLRRCGHDESSLGLAEERLINLVKNSKSQKTNIQQNVWKLIPANK